MIFEDGDVVQLKSGGPKMTIGFFATAEDFGDYKLNDEEDVVICFWFGDDNICHHETFFPATLMLCQ